MYFPQIELLVRFSSLGRGDGERGGRCYVEGFETPKLKSGSDVF